MDEDLPPTAAPVPTAAPTTAPVKSQRAETSDWISAVRLVSLLTLASRVLGLIRDMGMAAVFGNGPLLDTFTLAFRIPNLSRRLFGEGALTTAFLPEYLKARERGTEQGQALATGVLYSLTVGLSGAVLLGWGLILVLNGQSAEWQSSRDIYVMTGWMLPYVVFICVAAQLGALLHAQGKFAIPAMVPLVLNTTWIIALWLIVPRFATDQTRMQVVMIAILVGGVGQLILPWWELRRQGFRLNRNWRAQWPAVRRVYQLMLPVVLGLSITQLNAICDSTLAWWYSQPENGSYVAPGTASALYFGQRLYQFPLGVFGIALSTVLYARLAQHAQLGQKTAIRDDVLTGLRLSLLIGLPASVGLFLLSTPITACLLERGQFDRADTLQTAAAVAGYATAIWAYLGVSLLQKVFYALDDPQTPVRTGLIAVGVNLVLNFVLVFTVGGHGLAYATAIAAVVQCFLLAILLQFRLPLQGGKRFAGFAARVVLASGVMGLFLWEPVRSLLIPPEQWGRWGGLLIALLGATLIYAVLLWLLGIREMGLLLGKKSAVND